jgi:hypothetical protein
LKGLAEQVNSMITGLGGLVGGVNDAYGVLNRDISLLEVRSRSADCTSDAECAAIIRDILESTRVLKDSLAAIENND